MKRKSQNWLMAIVLSLAGVEAFASHVATEGALNHPGIILGQVTDSRGVRQAGVPVNFRHRDGHFVQKVYTESNGRFRAEGLVPGSYAIEVILPSFLPFWKAPVFVRSGAEILLDINLRALTGSLELQWPENPGEAREAWKQVLRSNSPLRPILRFQEAAGDSSLGTVREPRERALHGTVQFRAGNESQGFGQFPGLHTAFDMEYEWSGTSIVEIAGLGGWEHNTPATSFRVALDHQSVEGKNSTLSATMRQLFLPVEYWQTIGSIPSDGRVQSVTLGYENESSVGSKVSLHYGTLLDAVNVGEWTNRWSPFGRITYLDSGTRKFVLEFTAASPRLMPSDGPLVQRGVEQWLAIPQLSSNSDLRPALEEGAHVEASWEQEIGSQYRFHIAAFYDSLSQMAFAMAGTGTDPWLVGILRDPFSDRYFLSGGDYSGGGARTAVGAKIGENAEVIVGYSYAAGLQASSRDLLIQNLRALRDQIQPRHEHSIAVQLRSTLPRMQTQVITSYRWVPRNTVIASDPYNRGLGYSDPFLNLILLQPLPSPDILPGRFQAMADFSNLLGQGYLSVRSTNGEQGYLFPSARAFRGGFNFIF